MLDLLEDITKQSSKKLLMIIDKQTHVLVQFFADGDNIKCANCIKSKYICCRCGQGMTGTFLRYSDGRYVHQTCLGAGKVCCDWWKTLDADKFLLVRQMQLRRNWSSAGGFGTNLACSVLHLHSLQRELVNRVLERRKQTLLQVLRRGVDKITRE